MTVLASLKNPRVSLARMLSRRKERDRERAFVIEGRLAVEAALAADARILDLFATEEALAGLPDGVQAVVVTDQVMQAISDTQTPQGIAAIVEMNDVGLDALPLGGVILVLAEMRDPGNAGTLLRSAAATGAPAVVFTRGSVDPFSPKTVRSSAGSIFGPKIVRDADPEDTIRALESQGRRVYAAEAAAGVPMWDVDLAGPIAIAVGNEAWGLPEGVWASVERIDIPMPGPVESLNASVAGSLLLFEAVRQRRGSQG